MTAKPDDGIGKADGNGGGTRASGDFSDQLRAAAARAVARKRPGPPSEEELRRLAEGIVEGADDER